MSHDPLCPRYEAYIHEKSCALCDLIARVREDERGKDHWQLSEQGKRDGYAAALRDAVDNCWGAVAEIPAVELWDGAKAAWWIVKADALAAIEALGGETTEPADTGWSSGFWDKR